ncbi:MAG TPA: phosphatase [Epsilonproteobacteria bacterium]|nr:phosphatase [Campylobacterota bacterium]
MIAIDLGSNTLRVVQIDCKSMKIINEYEKTVKTADGLVQHGLINEKATTRVISAIKEAKEKIDFTSDTVKAVTTEAIRRAKNSDDVLLQIKKETGVAFKIISGEEEARLTLLAVKHRLAKLQYASDSFVLVDIGGGSTELIFHYDNEVISKSFPIGIVTIAQSYETLNTIQKALPKEMLKIQMFCTEVYATKGKVNSFVATAGTPTTVAAMKLGQTYATYDAKKINGTSLEMKELDFYLKKLLSLPFEEREIAVGTGRSNLIAAGILIFKQLYSIVEFDACVVIDDGLREGVALEECSSLH